MELKSEHNFVKRELIQPAMMKAGHKVSRIPIEELLEICPVTQVKPIVTEKILRAKTRCVICDSSFCIRSKMGGMTEIKIPSWRVAEAVLKNGGTVDIVICYLCHTKPSLELVRRQIQYCSVNRLIDKRILLVKLDAKTQRIRI